MDARLASNDDEIHSIQYISYDINVEDGAIFGIIMGSHYLLRNSERTKVNVTQIYGK